MAKGFYALHLSGGAADALDYHDGDLLSEGDIGIVQENGLTYFYKLSATSGAAEVLPAVIAPDTNPGAKRWILHSPANAGFEGTTVISSATTASAQRLYIFSASCTLTLPSDPAENAPIGIYNASGTTTCIIAGNGKKINGLLENLTIDILNASFTLHYTGPTYGWVTL